MAGRFVLHAGPHKTATTYVQQNFSHDRAALKQAGWRYPKFGTDSQHNAHHDIAHDPDAYLVAGGAHRAGLVHLGRRLKSAGRDLVLSAEGFALWPRQRLETLADLLDVERIDLVYAVRDPVAIFASHWAEEVKQGATASLPERFTQHFADPLESRILNPLNDLRPLLRSDRIRLHAVPFEVLRREGIDIYEHVCARVLGLEEIRARSTAPKNKAFPIELTEFLRMLTLMHSGGARRVGSAFRLTFMERTSPTERADLVKLVRAEAGAARRVVRISADASFRKRIETLLENVLAPHWTYPVKEGSILDGSDQTCVYYSDYLLWNNERVCAVANDILRRLGH